MQAPLLGADRNLTAHQSTLRDRTRFWMGMAWAYALLYRSHLYNYLFL
jgi:hypothetical protein